MNWNDICIKQYYELQEKQTFFSSTIFFQLVLKFKTLVMLVFIWSLKIRH
jgi:hypothetical protein